MVENTESPPSDPAEFGTPPVPPAPTVTVIAEPPVTEKPEAVL
jgi:hypothetical protein